MDFERLFLLREENDLTQSEMGKILNVNRVSISNWENGKEIIPLNKLNIYSNYFNVSLDFLLKINNNRKASKKIEQFDKKLVGQRLLYIRHKYKVSQEKLAELLNTTHSTISEYENGKKLILTSFAYQTCKTYNVSLDWLCGKAD